MGGFGRHTLLFLLWLNTATGTDANRNQPQSQFAMHMFRNRAPQFVHKPPMSAEAVTSVAEGH